MVLSQTTRFLESLWHTSRFREDGKAARSSSRLTLLHSRSCAEDDPDGQALISGRPPELRGELALAHAHGTQELFEEHLTWMYRPARLHHASLSCLMVVGHLGRVDAVVVPSKDDTPLVIDPIWSGANHPRKEVQAPRSDRGARPPARRRPARRRARARIPQRDSPARAQLIELSLLHAHVNELTRREHL